MSSIYQLTQQIHQIAQEKAKKYGLELVIESDKIIYYDEINAPSLHTKDYHVGDISMLENAPDWFLEKAFLLIQEPQIRHILTVFEEVFGENPEFIRLLNLKRYTYDMPIEEPHWNEWNKALAIGRIDGKLEKTPESQAEELHNRWFPFKDRPSEEQVLTELLEILKNI